MSKNKKHDRKRGGSKVNYNQIQDKILQLLNSNISKTYRSSHVIKKLGFRQKSINKQIPMILASLLKEGKIDLLKNGSYKSNKVPVGIIGIVDHVNSRFAYVGTGEGEDDIYVKSDDLNYAMDGDTVTVAVHSQRGHGKKSEGKVLEVIERSNNQFVGRIEFSPRFAFVIPDNR